ncbi:MAG: PEP-CTERM sorting domain-containing protein [bacterium]|nr:PEP-CTERM sorting domain-containing protein [bacterium]
MKGRSILVALLLGAALMMAQPASAAYISISDNLVEGVPDTFFDAGSGVLNIQATGTNLITLNDVPAIPAGYTISNSSTMLLNTTLSHVDGDGAHFVGGFYSLTFEYTPSGGGATTSHAIGGSVAGMRFTVNVVSPTFSTINGEGLFHAYPPPNLPGSNVWPDGGGLSSLDSVTLALDADLTGWNFDAPIPQGDPDGRLETFYSIFPDERAIPEPATLGLLACGALLLARRRR